MNAAALMASDGADDFATNLLINGGNVAAAAAMDATL